MALILCAAFSVSTTTSLSSFFSSSNRSVHNFSCWNFGTRKTGICRACLLSDPNFFKVGRLIGSYGFVNVTSYTSIQLESNLEYLVDDVGKLKTQDVGEGSVKIRLYEGRIVQGSLIGTPVIFKVYPGQRAGSSEADIMAANELNAHVYLQSSSKGVCQNILVLLGGFQTKMGEQWLAFRDAGKNSAASYAKVMSEKLSKRLSLGEKESWNPFDDKQTIKNRRRFVIKLFQGAMSGLAFMHDHDRLHQSFGPSTIVLNTIVEKDVSYLVPRLRDLAFSVDVRDSGMESDPETLSEGLWRRASAASAFTPSDKRAFGKSDDIYEAGLLLAHLAFVPFCEAGIVDSLSLRRLLENTFRLDLDAAREYCLADERFSEAVNFLDIGHGCGWELLQAMLNPNFKKRPTSAAVLNHPFLTSCVTD